eukprot:5464302-Lingulodinium_polyedra.AAC.1
MRPATPLTSRPAGRAPTTTAATSNLRNTRPAAAEGCAGSVGAPPEPGGGPIKIYHLPKQTH